MELLTANRRRGESDGGRRELVVAELEGQLVLLLALGPDNAAHAAALGGGDTTLDHTGNTGSGSDNGSSGVDTGGHGSGDRSQEGGRGKLDHCHHGNGGDSSGLSGREHFDGVCKKVKRVD